MVLCCANGDGKIAPDARAWVINFAAALNAPAGLLEELATYPADEDVFALAASSGPVVQSLRAVIYNAIFACAADGAYSPQEPDLIRRLGAQFGVIEAVISQIIDARFGGNILGRPVDRFQVQGRKSRELYYIRRPATAVVFDKSD